MALIGLVHGFVQAAMFSYSGTRQLKPTMETKIGSTSGGTVFTDLRDMVGKPDLSRHQQLPTHRSLLLQDTLVATMKAGFDQLTNILLGEKAQTSRKRPAIPESDDMSDSEGIKSIQAKRSRVSGVTLSDSGPVSDVEGDINSLIQQSTSLPGPSLGEKNEIFRAIVQEYDLEEVWTSGK